MIDYNATLQKFFDEVVLFLDKRKSRASSDLNTIVLLTPWHRCVQSQQIQKSMRTMMRV